MVTLPTERLFLRCFHILDREPMYRIFCDAEVMRFGDGVQTEAWVHGWLVKCLENYQKWSFGKYAVVERSSREVIGYCGLSVLPHGDGQPEIAIGYRLARSKWGHGYATEAAQAVRDYAFYSLCLKRLMATIDPHNVASLRVAEKIGMHYERDVLFEGYTYPDHVYVITVS